MGLGDKCSEPKINFAAVLAWWYLMQVSIGRIPCTCKLHVDWLNLDLMCRYAFTYAYV